MYKRVKKKARGQYEQNNHIDYHVLGFTSEEKNRYERFTLFERPNVLPILIELGITKQECVHILQKEGIDLPFIYKLGYPNANCIGCVKATSPTYWNHARKVNPDVFEHRAEQSRKIKCKLVKYKGQRIYLDELPENAKGRPMKNLNFECGIFCEETNDL